MSKEIWLGPLLGGNRSRLIQRCADLVQNNQAHRFLYLAASHPLLELVTQGVLDGAKIRGVCNELPVYLFRALLDEYSRVRKTIRPPLPRAYRSSGRVPLKRSLVSQILGAPPTGATKSHRTTCPREGCVNTITTLIGEIERAAKSPGEIAEIVASRLADLAPTSEVAADIARQIDFDKEVALIYSTYSELLRRNQLTEADADQMRALAILQGELDGERLQLPWLAEVELLVLDGFFDFTPCRVKSFANSFPCSRRSR